MGRFNCGRVIRSAACLTGGFFLQIETLAATAGAVDIRIVELEHLLQAFLDEIELRTVEDVETSGVDHYLRIVAIEREVACANLIRIVERVGKTRAADFLDAYA